MTDKPVLSVERDSFDTPVAERKPFAWYREPKDFPLQGAFFPYIEGRSERDIQNSLEAEFGFNVKRLYDEPAAQQQGEPVGADLSDEAMSKVISLYATELATASQKDPGFALAAMRKAVKSCLTVDHKPQQANPELAVWYGSMPESNGKSNWTAILYRKGGEGTLMGHLSEGITIDRSEYPDRVRYEADRMRYLIGELTEEPDILKYDETLHSGYKPQKADGQ